MAERVGAQTTVEGEGTTSEELTAVTLVVDPSATAALVTPAVTADIATFEPIVCLADETFFNDSCYFVSDYYDDDARKDFEEVLAACAERGAYPVVITTEDEQTFLGNLVNQYNNENYTEQYWTSATDDTSEGTWRWESGHVWGFPVNETPWREDKTEPNDGELANCGIFSEQGRDVAIYNLINTPCDRRRGYICERGNWPTCEDPGIFENGVLLTAVEFPASLGTVLEFDCIPGYSVSGNQYLECVDAPGWLGYMWDITLPLPQCIPSGQSCEDPDASLPLVWENDFLPFPVENGVTLTYECDTGSLVGSSVLMCVDGNWNADLPVCRESVNIAYNRSTSQSSTDYGGMSSLAVDGNIDSRYSGGSCTHTAQQDNPWWQINLGDVYDEVTVVIYNGAEYADRLDGADVSISPYENGQFTTCGTATSDAVVTITCPSGKIGQYITIDKKGSNEILTLCEVKVFGTVTTEALPSQPGTPALKNISDPVPSAGCDLDFSTLPNMTYISPPSLPVSNGSVITFACDEGFTMIGPSSLVCMNGEWTGGDFPKCDEDFPGSQLYDISTGQPAGQSSRVFGSDPDRVTDGNTNTNWDAGTCTQTKVEDNPWLKLDVRLRPREYIYYIVVTVPAMEGGIIKTAARNTYAPDVGETCGEPITVTSPSTVVIECDPPVRSGHVSIYVPGSNQTLSVCELQVFAKIPPVLTTIEPLTTEITTEEITETFTAVTTFEPTYNVYTTEKTTEPPTMTQKTTFQPTSEVISTTSQPTSKVISTTSQPTSKVISTTSQPTSKVISTTSQPTSKVISTTSQPTSSVISTETQPIITKDKTTPHTAAEMTTEDSYTTIPEPSVCSFPGYPPNGNLSDTSGISFPAANGTIINIDCCTGFEQSTSTLTCVEDESGASWQPPYPVCTPSGKIICSNPGNLANGTIFPDIEYPAAFLQILNFTCDPGFDLVGPSAIICNIEACDSGYRWSDNIPECVPSGYCATPTFPEYVGILNNSVIFPAENGTTVELKCNPAWYLMVGDPVTQCLNMTWTTMPNCTVPPELTTEEILTEEITEIFTAVTTFEPTYNVYTTEETTEPPTMTHETTFQPTSSVISTETQPIITKDKTTPHTAAEMTTEDSYTTIPGN
uniref:Uncharacterized protein LOC102801828 n=1 Tax=Saccoglossus kowalevskii TaxID=10224 RepID=A0ABM0MDB2_SACKO|nr:PREDICTED: uncharacterized protein LOC102801828 [Saccoglossus kowalevskii]